MSLEWFIYSLYAATLYVLFIIGKERFETSSTTLNDLLLLSLSFLLTVITGFILLCARSRISIPPSVVYAVLLIIFGALIMIITKERTFDASSLLLVNALLVLSLLGAWSVGMFLSFLNSILILFLLTKTQYHKFAFYSFLALSLLLVYEIW